MKVFSDSFTFSTKGEFDFVDLTGKVEKIVQKSGIWEGIALVFAGHATGVIVITEYESHLRQDIREFLQSITPVNKQYHHTANAFAHLRSMVLTPSKVVPIRNGKLLLGTWQSIFWVEAERRPRSRKVEVFTIGKAYEG